MGNTPRRDSEVSAAEWAESDAPTIQDYARLHRGTPDSRDEVRSMLTSAAEDDAESAALLARADEQAF